MLTYKCNINPHDVLREFAVKCSIMRKETGRQDKEQTVLLDIYNNVWRKKLILLRFKMVQLEFLVSTESY